MTSRLSARRAPLGWAAVALSGLLLSGCAGMGNTEQRVLTGAAIGFGGALLAMPFLQSLLPRAAEAQAALAEPLLVRALRNRRRQTNQEPPDPLHCRSSAFTAKNRSISAAVCSQSRVSARSCLRPTLVSR